MIEKDKRARNEWLSEEDIAREARQSEESGTNAENIRIILGRVCGNQAESEATTIAALRGDFNSFLGKMKTAGLMEPDPEGD